MSRSDVLRALREANGDKAARFRKSYERVRRDLPKISAITANRLDRVMREFRDDIREKLAALTGSPDDPFLARIVPEVGDAISNSLDTLRQGTGDEIRQAMADGFEAGATLAPKALRAVGVPVAFPSVSPALLQTLTASLDNVLDEIVSGLGDRIMAQVRLGAAALEPASATIRRTVDLFKVSEEVRKGLRRRIGPAFQAEAIARTEIGRAWSVAQQITSEELADAIPGLKKRWRVNLGKRRGHREAEAQYAPGGSTGPIPVKARFQVKDFSRTGTTSFLTLGKNVRPPGFRGAGQRVVRVNPYSRTGSVIEDGMLFPRDPAASVGNVVNCTCFVEEVVPDLERAEQQAGGIVS